MLKKIQPVIKTNISVTRDEYSAIINMRVFIIKNHKEMWGLDCCRNAELLYIFSGSMCDNQP